MARQKKPATPRPKRPTPAMVAVAGTAWQGFLGSLAVAVKWIDDAQELADLAQQLAELAQEGETVALDFETTGDFVAGGIRPRLVQLFAGGDEVAVADLEVVGFEAVACLADVGCVAYGAGFEARVFMGQRLEPKLQDAALAAGLRLDRDAFQRDLATTWRRIKKKSTPTNKKAMQRSDFSGELTPEQVAYAASDAVMAFQVWEACRQEARSKPYAIARDAIPAVASMEMAGFGYDHAAHAAILGEWNRLAQTEARRFNEMTGLWPKDQKKFRARLQETVDQGLLRSWPRASKGGLSLSGKALQHKPHAAVPEMAQYLRAKALGTLITTFGHKMMARASPMTRRLHFGFMLCGARTGRMTSSPNGQNLPAGPYRRIFRAPPGRRIVSLDYSAIELRAAALLAGETSLLDVFKHPPRLPNGERNPKGDPHEALSATLQLDPVRNAGLRLAKALNFRLLFGTGVEGFAENANISLQEAEDLIDRWRRVRSSMVRWQNGTKAAAKRLRYVTTPLGRRVNCYDVDPETKSLRFKPNRALNVPIQGGCAEALMVALPLAYDGLRGSGLSARLVAAVHDEIVFECAEADVKPAVAIVHQAMTTGLATVFGARPRFNDAALYAVGAPKIGQTWDGDVFDLASLSEKETLVLLKGLVEAEEDPEGEDDDGDEPAELEDDRDDLRDDIRETTLRLLRQVDPRCLRLAFRQAGVELLHKAGAAELADLRRRLSEELPVDETAEHCRLGPSSAGRWLNCPGSIAAVEAAPSYSTVHAHEGRKAHTALEWCLRLDVLPSQIVDPDNWPEVARSVEVALQYIRRQIGELHVEVRFMIDDAVGCGGTADTVAVDEEEIVVVDFKHGKHAIAVRDNDQLQTYAIGARKRFGRRKRYRLVIIQPRAGRPTDVTEWTITDAGLDHFEHQLLIAAKATMQDDAPRRAGAWCQWCPARATCDEYRARQAAEGEQ